MAIWLKGELAMSSILSIALGAIIGALIRWKLAESLNHLFPSVPLGTLIANLSGAFLMGVIVFLTMEYSFFSNSIGLGAITGFLGSLTTFSAFSAEAFHLISKQELFWMITLVVLHVAGSLVMLTIGYDRICNHKTRFTDDWELTDYK